jgi:hypothetical protein
VLVLFDEMIHIIGHTHDYITSILKNGCGLAWVVANENPQQGESDGVFHNWQRPGISPGPLSVPS